MWAMAVGEWDSLEDSNSVSQAPLLHAPLMSNGCLLIVDAKCSVLCTMVHLHAAKCEEQQELAL